MNCCRSHQGGIYRKPGYFSQLCVVLVGTDDVSAICRPGLSTKYVGMSVDNFVQGACNLGCASMIVL